MQIHRNSIFVDKTQDLKNDTNAIIGCLVGCGVSRTNIRIYDVSNDVGMQAFVEALKIDHLPVLFLWGVFYGDISAVQRDFESGALKLALLNNPSKRHRKKTAKQAAHAGTPSPPQEHPAPAQPCAQQTPPADTTLCNGLTTLTEDYNYGGPQTKKETTYQQTVETLEESYHQAEDEERIDKFDLVEDYENTPESGSPGDSQDELVALAAPTNFSFTFGDRWLNACEWVLRTITDSLPLMKIVPKEQTLPPQPGDVDFHVVRTNWYWRHQERIIRLRKDDFLRLDPSYFVRELFHYEDVLEVVRIDATNIVIHFSQNSQSQYLHCNQTDRLLEELASRCVHQLTVTSFN